MTIDNHTGLVLEGGGMRGVFTSGVLDYLMDHNLYFPYVIGVSAGAMNGISYVSRQRGRSHFSNIDILKKYNYIGFRHLLRRKGYIDLNFLFHVFPERYYPFDFKTYSQSNTRMVIVTSNCITGKAEYFEEKKDEKRFLDICQASCTLPVMCPISFVDNSPMVDGGVCDAIPIEHAINEGFHKNVIVLTRNKGYRKANKDFYMPHFIYHKYPAIREQLRTRYKRYNQMIERVEQLENEGKAIVIRPTNPLKVTRTTDDPNYLELLYQEGYSCGAQIKSLFSKQTM